MKHEHPNLKELELLLYRLITMILTTLRLYNPRIKTLFYVRCYDRTKRNTEKVNVPGLQSFS